MTLFLRTWLPPMAIAPPSPLKAQLLCNLPAWANDEDVVAAASAVRYRGKATKIDKGAIAPCMCALQPVELRAAASLAFLGALRISQLRELRQGDLQQVTKRGDVSEFVVFLRRDKRSNAHNALQETHGKPVDSAFVAVFTAAAASKQLGEPLFAKNIGDRLSLALRAAASALRWPTSLDWGGTHVFRHSGAARLQGQIEEIVTRHFAQQSLRTFQMYARPNGKRKRRDEKTD